MLSGSQVLVASAWGTPEAARQTKFTASTSREALLASVVKAQFASQDISIAFCEGPFPNCKMLADKRTR